MKKVQKWMTKKLKKISCFGSNGPVMMHVDRHKRTLSANGMDALIYQPQYQPQQQYPHYQQAQQQLHHPTPPPTHQDPRAELKSKLRNTILDMSFYLALSDFNN